MKHRLLMTSAIAGLAFFAATPAFANCNNLAPGNNATVTCTVAGGAETGSIAGSGSSGVTLNIDPNAAINSNNQLYFNLGANALVNIGAGATLTAPSADGAGIGAGSTVNIGAGATLTSGNRTINVNGSGVTINIGSGASVGVGSQGIAYNTGSAGTMAVTVDGTLSGLDANSVATTTLTLLSGYNITGNADASAGGGDTLVLGGTSNGAFDTDDIGGTFTNFDIFQKSGSSTWTLSGTNAQDWSIGAGTLIADYDNANNISGTGGTFQITNSSGSTQDFTGNITGGVSVLKSGGDFITLSGTNTFTGTLTVNNNTTLIVANAAAFSGTSGVTIDSSTFKFGSASTTSRNFTIGSGNATLDTGGFSDTISGNIGGTGAIGVAGGGILTLSGTNNYSGGTNVASGTRLAGNTTSLQGNISGSGFVDFSFTNDVGTYAGAISGSNRLFITGPNSAITLTGANTYSGGTQISNGTLIGNTTSIQGNIDNFATLRFDQSTNGTYAGVISQGGAVVKTGTGTVTFSGVNTYSGLTSINGGTLSVGASNNLGNAGANNDIIFNGGTLKLTGVFSQARDVAMTGAGTIDSNGNNHTISGVISGSGKLTKTGAGTLTLSGVNTFTGGLDLTVDGGVIVSADNNLGGAANIIHIDGAQFTYGAAFDATHDFDIGAGHALFNTQNFNATISGDITGTGQFRKSGAGTLTLTGTSSHTGGFLISAGGLTGTTANLQGNISNAGTLTFTQNTNGTYAGVISGGGTFNKNGTGNVTLSGVNTTTGIVNVTAGRLSVNGSLSNAAATQVNTAGTLGGTGTVSAITANAGGTIAPGNSVGTLHVNGGVAFNNGAHFDVEYDSVSSDLLAATGAVNIISTNSVLNLIGGAGTYAPSHTYTILTASAVGGTFGSVTNNLAFLNPTVIYNANNIQVRMDRNDIDFAEVAKDAPQADVADAVTGLGTGNAIFDQFIGLARAQAQDALDDLSGEHNAGIATAIAESTGIIQSALATHMNGLTLGGTTGDLAALAPAQEQDPSVYTAAYFEPDSSAAWNDSKMWLQVIGSIGKSDQQGTTPAQDRHSYGTLGGIDVPFADGGYYGVFAGYERGEVSTDSEGASSDLNNYHLGAYATRPIQNGFHISGGLGGTYHDIDAVRHITVGAVEFSPHGETNAFTANAFAQLSKPMQRDNIAIEPFGGVSLTYSHMQGYDETNGGAADLSVDSTSTTNPATIIGLRSGKSFNQGGKTFNVSGSLGWQHSFGDVDGKVTERFVGGTTSFDAFAPPRDRDAAVVGVGLDANIGTGMKAFAGYDGTLSANAKDHGFKAGMKWDF